MPLSVRRKVGLGAVAVALAAGVGIPVAVRQSRDPEPPSGALSPLAVPGRGAKVSFTEQEAETGETNGTVLAHDRGRGTLQAQASGRSAVTLDDTGEYVEFTLPRPANAVSFRYSIPDGVSDTSLDVLVGDALIPVPVTSRYGPGQSFDEARTMLGRTYPKAEKIRLQVSSVEKSPRFTIDLADFEEVLGPAAAPVGALDAVTGFGADPYGRRESTTGLQAALDAGQVQHKPVYLPRGQYLVSGPLRAEGVTLVGAGPWHTVLTGRGAGLIGDRTDVRDLAILGDVTAAAVSGPLTDSVIDNVWLQHTRTGVEAVGPARNVTVRNSRILDQAAGGVVLRKGVTDSLVENSFVRGSGDDGLTMWSQDRADVGNTFRRNTVVAPAGGNGIGIRPHPPGRPQPRENRARNRTPPRTSPGPARSPSPGTATSIPAATSPTATRPHLPSGLRQRGDAALPGSERPLPAGEHRGQQRLARRSAVRGAGLRRLRTVERREPDVGEDVDQLLLVGERRHTDRGQVVQPLPEPGQRGGQVARVDAVR